MIKLQNHCVFPFGFSKGKTDNFSYQDGDIYIFAANLFNTRDRQKQQFAFTADYGWRESRFPSLARVLLCLVRIVVPQVSWAVRYLDKP